MKNCLELDVNSFYVETYKINKDNAFPPELVSFFTQMLHIRQYYKESNQIAEEMKIKLFANTMAGCLGSSKKNIKSIADRYAHSIMME